MQRSLFPIIAAKSSAIRCLFKENNLSGQKIDTDSFTSHTSVGKWINKVPYLAIGWKLVSDKPHENDHAIR